MPQIVRRRVPAGALVVVVFVAAVAEGAPSNVETSGTRWMGVSPGSHAVGFEVRHGFDRSRRINASDEGTRVGLAIWYPAEARELGTALTSLDYRLLEFFTPPTEAERRAYEEDEVSAMVAWRHVGIVELTRAQARAALRTGGMAVRARTPARGRFPVVMMLGGRFYLSTTAEILASHGFVVVAPFRFVDQANDVGASAYSWYLENSVRDAEWALTELAPIAHADASRVSAIGHGGGGMQAMLFAMRNRNVRALVNIDAANFSERSGPRALPFYSPRLMRAPFLFIATAATKKGLDLFEDFTAMRFSERTEVILESPNLRHHDLSDLGRGVTAPLAIRGDAQAEVQDQYARVHAMIVRFLREHAGGARRDEEMPTAEWLNGQRAAGRYTVTFHAAVEAAPTLADALNTLDDSTPARLRSAHERDPDAPLFQRASLLRLIAKALTSGRYALAGALSELAAEVHPDTPLFQASRSEALERGGDAGGAARVATTCAAMEARNDWQATAAINDCRDRVTRLALRKR